MTNGPLAPAERALGPDLARGGMLLFIALANSHYFVPGDAWLGGYPQHMSALDAAVVWLLSTFVDGRAFPMFGLLFGYGVARIADRHAAAGPRAVRRLLRRRSLVLIGVGLADAVLFFVGDILAVYGVLLFAGLWLVRWKERWLLLIAVLGTVLIALPAADASTISTEGPGVEMLPPDVLTAVVSRVPAAAFIALLGPAGFVVPFVAGLWAGRRRVLEQPERHRRLLRITAAAGLGAAVLGAQPIALILSGVVTAPGRPVLELLASVHSVTGMLGGFGYAALLALPRRRNRVTQAIAATGQRSMTCYLLQSLTWAVVFTPYLLDLSGTLTVAGTALLATGTWAVSVLVADRLRRAGRRGPFEDLVRRVTYGRPVVDRAADGTVRS